MLALRELYDGKSVESRALVTAYNPEYGIVWQDSVTLPCSVPLSWIVSEYEVQSATASEDIEVGKLPGELIGHRFFRWDGNVRLVVNNPAKFPFWYTICMGDKTIAKGYATELDFARKDNGRKGYSMQIAYLQGENARTIRGELPFTEKNITMEVKTAATVYPGQSAKVEVAVKDRKGRPVKNADVTAYAFTSKFEALPPEVTIYGKSASGKAITPKNYEADEDFLYNTRSRMDWPLWRQRMGLDSIEYYKFLYPEPFYAYTEEVPGRLTQLSPYVVVDGEVQGIHVLWIDEQPHYFKQAQQLTPYSFPIWPGLHTLRLRTYDREVTVENVYAGEGLKTIVSVDGGRSAVQPWEASGDNHPVRISVREYGRKEKGMLTQRETALLTRHMITVDKTFGKATLLTGQPDRQSSYTVETELPGIINAGGVCYYLNGMQKQARRYRRYRPQAEAADPGRAVPLPGIHHRGHTGRYALFGYTCGQQFRDRGRLPLRHSEQLPETAELGAEPDPEAARTVHAGGLLRAGRAYGRSDPRHIQAAARRHGRKRIGADLGRPADLAHGQLPPATVHRQAGGRHKGTADHGVPAIDGQVPRQQALLRHDDRNRQAAGGEPPRRPHLQGYDPLFGHHKAAEGRHQLPADGFARKGAGRRPQPRAVRETGKNVARIAPRGTAGRL